MKQGLIEISTATNNVTAFIPSNGMEQSVAADNTYVYGVESAAVGFFRFDPAAKTVTHVASGGLPLGILPMPGGAVSLLQTLNTVLTSDPATGQVAGKINDIPGNAYLTLSSDGSTVLGTSPQGTGLALDLISTVTHKVTQVPPVTLSGLNNPYPAISPGGTTAYIVNNILSPDGTVSVVDLATGAVTASFSLGFTFGSSWSLAISPDGSTLYANNFGPMSSAFCSISLPSNTFTLCAPFGAASADARPIAISADGSKLYLPDLNGGLSELDAQTLTVTRSVNGSVPDADFSNVVYSQPGNCVYVATPNGANSLIARVDLGTFQINATAALTFPPADLGATPDGTEVLVVGGPTGTTVLDGTTLTTLRTIATGVTQSVVVATR